MLRASLVTVAVPMVVIVAGVAFTAAAASSVEGWTGLGYALTGMAVTALVALVALLVTARVAFARTLPAGHRLVPAAALVVGVIGVVLVPWLVGARGLLGGSQLAGVLLLPLPVLLPLAVTGHLRWRWVAGAAGAVVVVLALGGALEARRAAESDRADVAVFGDALPLAGGRSFDSPLPGYRHLITDVPHAEWSFGVASPMRIQWRSGRYPDTEENYVVSVSLTPTNCHPVGDTPTCVELGQGTRGPVVRADNGTRYVFVRVGGVEWRVEGLSDDDARTVLDSLEPVDADTFWRADQDSGELN